MRIFRLRRFLIAVTATASFFLSSMVLAAPIVFDVTSNGVGTVLNASGMATVAGVTLTIATVVNHDFNPTPTQAAINQPANPPSPPDDPTVFDAVPLAERLFLSFDTTIMSIAIDFVGFEAGDLALLTLGANTLPTITSGDLNSEGSFFFSTTLAQNTGIALAFHPGSASPWAIEAVEITIPLPASAGLLGLALASLSLRRRTAA